METHTHTKRKERVIREESSPLAILWMKAEQFKLHNIAFHELTQEQNPHKMLSFNASVSLVVVIKLFWSYLLIPILKPESIQEHNKFENAPSLAIRINSKLGYFLIVCY